MHNPCRIFFATLLSTIGLLFAVAEAAQAAPVLMISIDGLKPEYVTQADAHGLKIPILRRFVKQGAYADGVIPVVPSVTYPDHTTLITGVWPAVHGVYNNTIFDPERKFQGAWYWYAESIRVPTLWDVARKAHIATASVSWPVSVNATSVDTLIPEYWREESADLSSGNPQDAYLMDALSRPDGMLAEREKRLGAYLPGNDTTVEGDRVRTRFSVDILEREKPGFMTIHLSSLDETEHMTGPFSPDSDSNLEAIDGMVGQLMEAALKVNPATVVVIVSDHGFAKVEHSFNIAIPFLKAGLIEVSPNPAGGFPQIKSWKAEPWASGGLAAVMLHDPADTATRDQVREMLTKLAADPQNGIAAVLDQEQIKASGGFPDAAFLLVLKPGYLTTAGVNGPLVNDDPPMKGAHGYLSTFAEMHASFFALGNGVARGRDLGTIDMRRIAPTVAGLLGIQMPSATEPKLDIQP